MATIDIGKIKPVFKGTYDNTVSYVLDDIVYYNGSSYVAKTSTTGNLPTDTTKWNVLASGSGGIWDSSLSIGTANQLIRVNSGATGLEFHTPATVTSDFVKLHSVTADGTATSVSIDGYFSSTYKRYVLMGRGIWNNNQSDFQWRVNTGGSTDTSSSYSQTNWQVYTDNTPSHQIGVTGMNEGSVDLDSPATRFEFNGDSMTDDEDTGCDLTIEIFDPQASNKWKNFAGQIWYVRSDKQTIQTLQQYSVFKSQTALTGITLMMRSGNIYGTFDLYGYKA